jgi:serine protease Do
MTALIAMLIEGFPIRSCAFIRRRRHSFAALALLICAVGASAQIHIFCRPGDTDEAYYRSGRHATPGYLGVGLRDLDKDAAQQLRLPDRHGAEVVSVDRDAPAGDAGIRARDVLRSLNGTPIESSEHLRRMLHALPPGRQILLALVREGEQIAITLQLADQAQVAAQAWHPDPSNDPGGLGGGGGRSGAMSLFGAFAVSPLYTGAELDPLSTQLADFFGVHDGAGMLVRTVNQDSPASVAGLKAGDVILRVNSQPVVSRMDWMKQLHENRGRPMLLTVIRNKQQQTLTLTTGEVKKKS